MRRENSTLLIFIFVFSLIIFSFLMLSIHDHALAQEKKSDHRAVLLEINGAIGPAIQDYIERGIRRANNEQAKIIILQMDTPGGLSTSMRGIIQAILASNVPVVSYVAPSGARAASAGTYILYASHIAAMAPGTNLGAATPVNLAPLGEQEKEKKETKQSPTDIKAVNDAKAYIRSLAQLRKRNVEWSEKAVAAGESISATEALKINVINVIAENIDDLLKKIDGMKVFVNGQIQTINTQGLVLSRVQPDWRVRFLSAITDPSVAYILLMIGFYGLFFEFANPGFFAPGIIGAIALLLALYAFQLLPINYAGLGLIILGIGCIVAEFFMPTFGALGVGGIISFMIGSVLLLKEEGLGFALPLRLIIAISIITGLFFLGVLHLAWRARHRPIVSGRERIIGQQGVIEKSQGKLWVRIEGERWKVESEFPLNSKQIVEVVAMEGLTLKVKPVEKKP